MTRGPDPARRDLDARVLAWMREPAWRADDARFEALALELFAFQWERCPPYRRFCEGRGVRPATLSRWQQIPAVPTGAFKELELRSFPAQRSAHVFRTSGTSTSTRGALHLDTLELYEASLLPSFARFVLPDLAPGERAAICVLAPSPGEAPDSSLSHMFGVLLRELGTPESGFFLREGALRADELLAALARAGERGRPHRALRHRVRVRLPARRARAARPHARASARRAHHGDRRLQGPLARARPRRALRRDRGRASACPPRAS